MQFNNHLFRCSSLGHLMTEPKAKADKEAGNLSESAKMHLIDCYVSAKYNRQTEIQSRYIQKGLMVEEDAITLYSRLKKSFFKKNEQHLSNDFIKGTPDLFTGSEILKADKIIDTKSSWDLFTFFRVLSKELNNLYYWQMQGYMMLTGAKSATVAYCLVNTPLILIEDEKRKLLYKMGVTTSEDSIYLEACEELERSMIYDDIVMSQRLIEFEVERNEEDIKLIEAKVLKAREWLNEFEQKNNPESVLIATHNNELQATIIDKF
jgi:hypothetical protein